MSRGFDLLRTKPYLPADFDQEIFDSLWTVWSASEKAAVANLPVPERRKAIADHYGLVVDPDSSSDDFRLLGYVSTESGWCMNCLACHAGQIEGNVVLGLGNNRVALQSLTEDVRTVKLLRFQKLSHLDLALLKLPLNQSNGSTNSVIFGVVLGALRNPDMSVDKSRPVPPLKHHDMDAPPWWRLAKKERLYADGFAPKNHRTIMQFMMLPQHGRETFIGWEDDYRHILAWMESLRPPKFPKALDPALVESGRILFEKSCAECHGRYGSNHEYPETVVPLSVLGTDPLRLEALSKDHRQWMKDGWMSHFGQDRVDLEPAGYVAPPLDGIWATAPYLHNGSVPNLEQLLQSETRPKVFRQTANYDLEGVGIGIESSEEVPQSISKSEQRWYFDTRAPGKSNAGHTFGDHLAPSERRALLEYLKSL